MAELYPRQGQVKLALNVQNLFHQSSRLNRLDRPCQATSWIFPQTRVVILTIPFIWRREKRSEC